ncbi:hypothetical protein K438DRAFT_1942388 [Mycena galopus ATCC 62051]|nr:hypothetical protein K438DRAFT_1942388 [Mycena galopus ATCC 62051]
MTGFPNWDVIQPSQFQTVNIYGGVGGDGGRGGEKGGGGGTGEGPLTNIKTVANLVIQNQPLHDWHIQLPADAGWPEGTSRELSGSTRKVRRKMGARQTPYARGRDGSLPQLRHPTPKPLRSMHGGTFITAETLNHHGEAGINILHRAVALEALHDSADSFPQPRCHAETRAKMLDDLYNWAVRNGSARPIRWLHGPAGAGKSALMQTLYRKLRTADHLGGAFFFKRSHTTRGNANALFATLAYQLALNSDELKLPISRSVECDPSVVGRLMDIQLQKLIVEPCQSLANCPPVILLIDGLDECQDQSTQQEIIRWIGKTAAGHRHFPTLRFLIASRPEAHICEIFEDSLFHGILDSMIVKRSFEDIRTYFYSEFTRIHREHHTMVNVPTPWPSWEILENLVHKSSGYFIYAATVIRFIDDKYSRPTERLAVIQTLSPADFDAPFATLDQLYIQILSGVPTRFHSTLRDILQCVFLFKFDLNPIQLDRLLELEPGDVRLILRGLHSVLQVPSDTDTISVHHASFLDFLQDQRRSSIFYFDPESRKNVTQAFLKILSHDRFDTALAWYPTANDFIKCIDLTPPSAELVPQIQRLNPDVLWGLQSPRLSETIIQKVLIWLKAIQPTPEDLIQRWEYYHFMVLWDASYDCGLSTFMRQVGMSQILSLSPQILLVLQTKMSGSLLRPLADCRQFVARSPEFARIFQAQWLLYSHLNQPHHLLSVYHLHQILGVSWDETMATLVAVRSIVDRGSRTRLVAGTFTILLLVAELHPVDIPGLIGDLSCGILRLIQRASGVDRAWYPGYHMDFLTDGASWGSFIRYSRSSPQLRSQLDKFVPQWQRFPSFMGHYCLGPENFYNVLQWLKAQPDLPLGLVERWQGYSMESRKRHIRFGFLNDDHFERHWRAQSELAMGFSKYSAKFVEEKVIGTFEHVLKEIGTAESSAQTE